MAAARSGYSRLTRNGNNAGYGTNDPSDHNVAYAGGSPTEFFQRCDLITTNLFSLNKSATTLERSLKQIGTSNDCQILRDRITHVNGEAGGVISETTNLLRSVHALTNGDKQRRIRTHRLQTEFQASATRFSEMQKKAIASVRKARLPPDMVATELDQQDSVNRADLMEREGVEQLKQKQDLKMEEREAAMLQEREIHVQELESDIVNINDIMRELSSMVVQQGEVVSTIENNVESAHGHVEEAREELIKAASYQSKYRKRICWLVLILVIVLAIIAIILAIHFSFNSGN